MEDGQGRGRFGLLVELGVGAVELIVDGGVGGVGRGGSPQGGDRFREAAEAEEDAAAEFGVGWVGGEGGFGVVGGQRETGESIACQGERLGFQVVGPGFVHAPLGLECVAKVVVSFAAIGVGGKHFTEGRFRGREVVEDGVLVAAEEEVGGGVRWIGGDDLRQRLLKQAVLADQVVSLGERDLGGNARLRAQTEDRFVGVEGLRGE